MYWLLDAVCFLAGLLQFSLALVYGPVFTCWVGLLWIALYPLLLELLANLYASLHEKVSYSITASSHLVYSKYYNISFCGLERLHPFDSHKYGNIYQHLIDANAVKEDEIIRSERVPRELLL